LIPRGACVTVSHWSKVVSHVTLTHRGICVQSLRHLGFVCGRANRDAGEFAGQEREFQRHARFVGDAGHRGQPFRQNGDPGFQKRGRHLSVSLPIGLEKLWTKTLGDPRVCIALLDGPVDLSHPCFAGACLEVLRPFASGHEGSGAARRHGTQVASILFGQHGSPVRGIAPACRGLILPVFWEDQAGEVLPCSQLDLARAITQAVQQGASVINISGGQFSLSAEPESYLAQAIRLCTESGVLIVAAAGNNGCQCLQIPAAVSSVLAVGAMDAQGSPLPASNWGRELRLQGILAPGENIPVALPDGGTSTASGTSFAAPIVSGTAALLLSLEIQRLGKFNALGVRELLLKTAEPCDAKQEPDCRRFLLGRLNIPVAVAALQAESAQGLQPASQAALPSTTEVDSEATGEKRKPTTEGELLTMPVITAEDASQTTVLQQTASPPPEMAPAIVPAAILPSACSCGGNNPRPAPALVYVLGQIGHDFSSEARRDSFVQQGVANTHDAGQILTHLDQHPANAAAIVWTLNQETTPVYAIHPGGPFAAETYARLRTAYKEQSNEGVERVSIPGWVVGQVVLLSGQVLPTIYPELRGIYSWSTPALVDAILGKPPENDEEKGRQAQRAVETANFLDRIYYEIRNLGQSPQDRAMNYAATNAFQLNFIYKSAIEEGLKLDSIGVERSPICRPASDCWDVKLTFFNPARRLEQARVVYRFTVDVSDVVPVTVGQVRHWHVY
jgi:cyanobactin maturation PatA/PatG family protease